MELCAQPSTISARTSRLQQAVRRCPQHSNLASLGSRADKVVEVDAEGSAYLGHAHALHASQIISSRLKSSQVVKG